eukprot:Gb_24129 [translate_table: standard]
MNLVKTTHKDHWQWAKSAGRSNYALGPMEFNVQDLNGNKMINEYVREHKIGTGSYGKVVLHRNIKDGKQYAMKYIPKTGLHTNSPLSPAIVCLVSCGLEPSCLLFQGPQGALLPIPLGLVVTSCLDMDHSSAVTTRNRCKESSAGHLGVLQAVGCSTGCNVL